MTMTKDIAGGYNGKLLRVDLSENRVSTEDIDNTFCRKYLGGSGFITYFLLKELKQGIDPLGPDNKLIYALGPLTGTSIMGSGRHSVGAKSPLGGNIALSQAGDFWGAELKRAGYDVVIIQGKASTPAYIWIHDGQAEIRDASGLWGKNTKETQQIIRSELNDDKIRVSMIGPAGENLVNFSCIMHGTHNTAGRGGLGAVMGSKKLKAVAVRGHRAPQVANPERVKEIRQWFVNNLYKDWITKDSHENGTGSGPLMEMGERLGFIPVRNWRDGKFPGVKKIHAGVIKDTMRIGMEGCFGCPVRCKKVVKFDEPYPVDPAYGGPEFETLGWLGTNCGIDDLKAIVKGNELCNAYSLDTISTGSAIAFSMECFEKGLLNEKDTGGIELRFGNAEAMLKCIDLIAQRRGFGDFLAGGVARMAKTIGKGSEDFAMHVKGIDTGVHEPRKYPSIGLGYMINPHGADHVCNVHDNENGEIGLKSVRPLGFNEVLSPDDISPGKVAQFKVEHHKQLLLDCLTMCHFFSEMASYETLVDITASVTGWDTGIMEQQRIAERILTAARLFNIREGFTASDDRLPHRFFQPKSDGSMENKSLDPQKMENAKRYYYTLMGWDEEGVPLPEKVQDLGI